MSQSATANIFQYLKLRLSRRSVVFVLCLLLSSLFWLLTSLSKEYVDQIVIPVKYTNVPEGTLIENKPIEFVNAEVKGFGFDLVWHWLQFEDNAISIQANPDNLKSLVKNGDEIHYVLTESKTGKLNKLDDEEIEVLKIEPDTLFLKFQPIHTKVVPVKLDISYSFVRQFGIDGEVITEPDSIRISGLESLVQEIGFVSTEMIEWSDLDESVSEEVELVVADDTRLVSFDRNSVQVTLNVQEFTEGTVTVPLSVNTDVNEVINLYPNKVEIKYLVSLADFDKITSDMFEARVTLKPESKEQKLLFVEITKYPLNIRQPRANPAKVEYILRK